MSSEMCLSSKFRGASLLIHVRSVALKHTVISKQAKKPAGVLTSRAEKYQKLKNDKHVFAVSVWRKNQSLKRLALTVLPELRLFSFKRW